jgi:LysR family transcriptional regulator, glycine cleavage system transcriptional activator
MSKRFPPLNPLRTFEVAAHCKSFTEAAEELGVTQAAVSRQISVLEGFFKAKLFDRDVRSIKLTPIGRQLHDDVSSAFQIIRWSTERVFLEDVLVRVHTYPTFAARWLMPRLANFMSRFPNIDLQVQTAVKPVDFSKTDADVVIQFGRGDWPDMHAHPLVPDLIEPVCSPNLASIPHAGDLGALLQQTLLTAKYRSRDWTDWLAHAGLESAANMRWLAFESSILTFQAAIESLGVAMGQTSLLSAELKSGALIRPFDMPHKRGMHYWIVWPGGRRLAPEARKFVDWIISQSESETRAAAPPLVRRKSERSIA